MNGSALTGESGVVTGAASGIGRATALRLAGLGANVLAVDINGAGLKETARMAPSTGSVAVFELDLLRPDSGTRLVERATELFSHLDFFFNNAGVEGPRKPLTDISDEEWDDTVAINVTAAFRALRAVVPAMRGKGGRIVNVGSCLGVRGAKNTSVYGTSKAAVASITRVLAAEEAVNGISVNCINAGPIQTELHDRAEASYQPKTADEAPRRGVESMIPLGRLGTPDEIAQVAVFLLSPGIPYLTGAEIAVDGGMTAALFRS